METTNISLEVNVNVPVQKAWAVWTNPDDIKNGIPPRPIGTQLMRKMI